MKIDMKRLSEKFAIRITSSVIPGFEEVIFARTNRGDWMRFEGTCFTCLTDWGAIRQEIDILNEHNLIDVHVMEDWARVYVITNDDDWTQC